MVEIGEMIRYCGEYIFLYYEKRLMLRLLRIDAIEIGDRFSVEVHISLYLEKILKLVLPAD